MLLDQGKLDEAVREYRAAVQLDPKNPAAYMGLGRAQQAQGDLAAALTSYQEARAITQDLVHSDPGNAGWQRDLTSSLSRIGDVQQAQGDLAAALTSYQEARAIAERVAQADPSSAGWQRDLVFSLSRIGDVQQALGDLVVRRNHRVPN